jgi:hypothetical protein
MKQAARALLATRHEEVILPDKLKQLKLYLINSYLIFTKSKKIEYTI